MWHTLALALGHCAEEQATRLCNVLGMLPKALAHPDDDVGVKPGMAVAMCMAVAMLMAMIKNMTPSANT